MEDLISKIKKANLTGRGGAGFSSADKWRIVSETKADKKYIVCNLSEGEPGILKDKYILDNFMEEAVAGIKLAVDFLGAERAYIYTNPNYYEEYHHRLRKIIRDDKINVFKKDHSAGYIGGEETSALNHIEGRKVEPRLRPPFPTTAGLWGFPTLVNNLETFFHVYLISLGKYEGKRFFTIGGDCLNRGVYEFSEKTHISDILHKTSNYPDYDFFVQVGGDASGLVLNSQQLDTEASGSASITVYSLLKHRPMDLIRGWANFFQKQSCGQCTPCRDGLLRLCEILNSSEPDWEMGGEILNNLSDTSFCGLGTSAPIAIKSYAKNVLANLPNNKINFPNANNDYVCDCFKK